MGCYNFGVAVVNDTLYVIGGHTYVYPGDFGPSPLNEQYTPFGYIPEFPSWIILPLFFTASMVVIIYRNRLRKKGRSI